MGNQKRIRKEGHIYIIYKTLELVNTLLKELTVPIGAIPCNLS